MRVILSNDSFPQRELHIECATYSHAYKMDLAIIKTWAKGCLNVTASWYFFGVDVRKRRTVLPIYFFLFVLLNLTPVISDFYVVLIDGILEQI